MPAARKLTQHAARSTQHLSSAALSTRCHGGTMRTLALTFVLLLTAAAPAQNTLREAAAAGGKYAWKIQTEGTLVCCC